MVMKKKQHTPEDSQPKLNKKVLTWLDTLHSTLEQKREPTLDQSKDTTYSLRYILGRSSKHKTALQLSLLLVRRLKSGKLGSIKAFNEYNRTHENYLTPTDRKLLLEIEIADRMVNPYEIVPPIIKGELFDTLLPKIIESHRCHWETTENPPLTLTEPQSFNFEWTIDDQGFQKLDIQQPASDTSKDKIEFYPIVRSWYLNQTSYTFGLLDTDLNVDTINTILNAPRISPNEIEAVSKNLLTHPKLDRIKQPKVFREKKITSFSPMICLNFSEENLTLRHATHRWFNDSRRVALATLSFRYDNIDVLWIDKRDELTQYKNDNLIVIPREKQLEALAFAELKSLKLPTIKEIKRYQVCQENHADFHKFLIADDYQLLDAKLFSENIIPTLKEKGWRITFSPDYSYPVLDDPIDDWYSEIHEHSENHWFNLELGITVNGEKINLLPVLSKLIREMRSENQTLDLNSTQPIIVTLDDGRQFQLPIERVRNIMHTLIELYDNLGGNYIQLDKNEAARLLEIEAALGAAKLRWYGGERLRSLAEKLTTFKGLQEVKLPKGFKGELRHYQQDGLNWMQFLREYEFGGILADDMGLGKTVQALAHITVEKKSGRMVSPTLIVAPTSLMFNWEMEAKKFAPHLKVLVLHGSARKKHYDSILEFDVILTTYPLLKFDKAILLQHEFHLLILDEAQCIKNTKAFATQIVQQIKANHRLCLSGTPLENHLGELWSLFNFIMPGLLGDERKFNQVFRYPIEKDGDQDRRKLLAKRVAPFMLRRTKSLVVQELPEKVEMIRQVDIEDAQRDLYETIRLSMQEKVRKEIATLGMARSHIIILDALLKLRQICCDPRLLKMDNTKIKKSKSAKLELLMSTLPELIEEGRRILLFSQFTEMLALIEIELKKNKIEYVKLTGQTRDRATPVKQFQEGEVPLFLISLKAGGTGLNLTAADTVIHYDPWWNPAVEDQATDRAHRIGQDKTVFVYKFVTKGTVEEKIVNLQKSKRNLMAGIFSENATGKMKLTEKDLAEFFEPL